MIYATRRWCYSDDNADSDVASVGHTALPSGISRSMG